MKLKLPDVVIFAKMEHFLKIFCTE